MLGLSSFHFWQARCSYLRTSPIQPKHRATFCSWSWISSWKSLDFFLKFFGFPELWYGIVVEQLKIVACRYKSTLKGAEASWIQLGVRFEWAQIIIRNLEISKHASLNSLELTNKKTNKQTNTQIIWSYFGLSKDAQHFANLNSSWNMGEVNVDCPAMMMTMIIVWWRVMQMKRGTVVGR